ncbi:MAG: recombination protein RecR [Acidobacteria bacterium]|nr:recombination protein RecR [Acidobacteriota bacterium]
MIKLPGIGRRSAQRIAFHLSRQPEAEVRALAATLIRLPEELHSCRTCGNLASGETCSICNDPRRESDVICVVEQADNLNAIEKTGAFRGRYHVLGGSISPLRSVGPQDLRIDALLWRVREGAITEVILATNPTVEGEATALYIARQLADSGTRVTRPATGLPVGGELEYVDGVTLTRALAARRGVLDDK